MTTTAPAQLDAVEPTAAQIDAGSRAIMTAFIKKWFLGSYRGPVYLDCVNGEKAWEEETRACIKAALATTGAVMPTREEWAEMIANNFPAILAQYSQFKIADAILALLAATGAG